MGSVTPDRSRFAAVAAAGGAVLLAWALGWSNGFYGLGALLAASGSAALAIFAASRAPSGSARPPTTRATALLGIGLGVSLAFHLVVLPGYYVDPGALGAFRPLVAIAAVATASYGWSRVAGRLASVRFGFVLLLVAGMGALVIEASPRPHIDTWYVQRLGALALTRGENPYELLYPNIYGPDATVYGDEVLTPDRLHVRGNPYPPLTLLLLAPGAAVGLDPRWTMLACLLASAWAIRRLGRGTRLAELAAVFVLLQPSTLLVLEQSWTEPTVLACVLAAFVAVEWWRDRSGAAPAAWLVAGAASGLALASKQYAPLLVLPLAVVAPPAGRTRAATVALAIALALSLPFVVSDPAAFVRSVVTFQMHQPFRPDALSWSAGLVAHGGPELPAWLAFVLAGATLAATLRRDVTAPRALLAASAAWLVFVLFSKQAFCNYYWLAVGLMCAGVAGASRAKPAPPSPSPAAPGR